MSKLTGCCRLRMSGREVDLPVGVGVQFMERTEVAMMSYALVGGSIRKSVRSGEKRKVELWLPAFPGDAAPVWPAESPKQKRPHPRTDKGAAAGAALAGLKGRPHPRPTTGTVTAIV